MNTPNYIANLHIPTPKPQNGKKVWSIDLESVWRPYLTATNTMGITALPPASLGYPLRLGYDKTGAVRFSQSGRPVIKVAKEVGDEIRKVRDNFTANLLNYAKGVKNENGDAFKAQVELGIKAGKPIAEYDKVQLHLALQAIAEAEAKAKAEAEAKAKAEAVAQAEAITKAETEAKAKTGKRELAHA